MPQDKYQSLTALKAALRARIDYRIRVVDRNSWITIIAPHGGFIDAGTSAIARTLADRSYNLYDFQGLRRENAAELHVTSTRFRDSELSKLLKNSQTALAVHWMGSCHEPVIWLGGLNKSLKDKVLIHLRTAGFSVNPDSPRYRGESLNNIVNLPSQYGVQLEISDELMARLFQGATFLECGRKPKTTAEFHQLVKALREALCEYRAETALTGDASTMHHCGQ